MAASGSSGGNAGALQLLLEFTDLVDRCSTTGQSLVRKLNEDVVYLDDAEANRNNMGGALLVTKHGGHLSVPHSRPYIPSGLRTHAGGLTNQTTTLSAQQLKDTIAGAYIGMLSPPSGGRGPATAPGQIFEHTNRDGVPERFTVRLLQQQPLATIVVDIVDGDTYQFHMDAVSTIWRTRAGDSPRTSLPSTPIETACRSGSRSACCCSSRLRHRTTDCFCLFRVLSSHW